MTSPHIRTPGTPRTPAASQPTDTIPLPAAQTFDFVAPLHALLSRLVPDPPGLAAQHGQADGTVATSTDDTTGTGVGHLDIQQLGPEANGIKVRIQKARAAVKGLPDVSKSLQEQEEDIKLLEARIAKMREMLRGLGKIPDEDVEMT